MYILICWSVAGRPGTSVLFLGEIPMLPAHTLRPEERVKPAPPVWPTYGWATPALRPTKPAIPRVAGRPTLLSRGSKCLHYYFYFLDAAFGLIYLRVPTWCPFRLQFYCNGHNWLARQLTDEGIRYTMADNAFVRIGDWSRAQELADR